MQYIQSPLGEMHAATKSPPSRLPEEKLFTTCKSALVKGKNLIYLEDKQVPTNCCPCECKRYLNTDNKSDPSLKQWCYFDLSQPSYNNKAAHSVRIWAISKSCSVTKPYKKLYCSTPL